MKTSIRLFVVLFTLFVSTLLMQAQVWTQLLSYTNALSTVACSADGTTIITSSQFGAVYVSTNSGLSWSTNKVTWVAPLAVSSYDGSRLVLRDDGNHIYTSTNSGLTWRTNAGPGSSVQSIAASADGRVLMALSGWSGDQDLMISEKHGS